MKKQITELPDLDSLHQKYAELTKKLIAKKIHITTMESCTSGFIASLITDTEGSSAILKGACITYSNEAKIMEGVCESDISTYGVYSNQTALEMARACSKKYKAEVGVGVTGTFGNVDPNNKDSVPGKVFFAIVKNDTSCNYELTLPPQISRFQAKLCVAWEVGLSLEEVLK